MGIKPLVVLFLASVSLPAQTVVAHWDFHNGSGSTVTDIGGSGYNGTIQAGAPWILAKTGSLYGLNLNPTLGQYVSVPNGPLPQAGDFSVAVSVQVQIKDGATFCAAAPHCVIFGAYQATTPFTGWGLGVGLCANTAVINLWNGSAWNCGTVAINDAVWHRIVATFSGTTLTFYVDGSLDTTLTGITHPSAGYAGAGSIGATSSATAPSMIQIADAEVWSTALSSGQVTTDFTNNSAHLTAVNPIAASSPVPFGQPFVVQPVNGLAVTPACGWSSWYYSFVNGVNREVSDASIRAQALAMVNSGLYQAGGANCPYIWAVEMGVTGRDVNAHPIYSRMPNPASTIAYVHSLGLKISAYTEGGKNTCAGYYASYGYETSDAAWFASLGFDAVEYDACNYASTDFPTQTALYGVSNTFRYIYEYFNTQILAANWHPLYGILTGTSPGATPPVGVTGPLWSSLVGGNYWRYSEDTENVWSPISGFGGVDPNDFDAPDLSANVSQGNWALTDISPTGNNITCTEGNTVQSIWAIVASGMQMSTNVTPGTMTTCTWQAFGNYELIKVLNDSAALGGYKALTAQGCTGCEVWVRQLNGSQHWAIALLNRSSSTQTVTTTWSSIATALAARSPSVVFQTTSYPYARDIWAHTDIGPLASGYSASVPSHGTAMIVVTNVAPPPYTQLNLLP